MWTFISVHDVSMMLLSMIFIVSVYACVEVLRRLFGFGGMFSRKMIHIVVALWGCWAYFAFYRKESAIILTVIFFLANVRWIRNVITRISAIDGESHPGMIYYPISMCLLFLFCWDVPHRYAGIIGLLNLGLGDSFAAIAGSKYGKKEYRCGDRVKTYLGSVVMFCTSLISTAIVLACFQNGFGLRELSASIVISAGATLFEATSNKELDNLTVPLCSALIFSFFYKM